MLWQYILLLFTVALVSTIFSFHKNIEKIGQLFFMLLAGVMWPVFAVSLVDIDFRWGGASASVSYNFIPGNEAWGMVYGFGIIGLVLLIIGLVRAIDMVYTPITDTVKDPTYDRSRMVRP